MDVPDDLRDRVGGHPLVAEALVRRGFSDVPSALAFLDPAHYSPAPATDLPNIVAAAERLERAIEHGETVCVWGDFDVDGQTSTTLLVSSLRDLGADVIFHIPVREKESHGVNIKWLDEMIDAGAGLVLTCDTGVTAIEPVEHARRRGVDVVITDHHDLPDVLPEATAIVNPKMLPQSHPLGQLPAVGCAYKLAELMYDRAGRASEVEQYLDLVALGIVADVAEQTGDTRYLLQRGLDVLRNTPRVGLLALMADAELDPSRVSEEHIGFVIAPRLNSLGRLANAQTAVEFLTTADQSRARILAKELDGLNTRRKLLVQQVIEAVEGKLEREPALLRSAALVVDSPSWPAGVLGIVAGRLAERYGKPAVLIVTPPDGLSHGSARSVPGCNITEAFAAHSNMLIRFGGHPMAAGLTLKPERIPEFREALSETVASMIGGVQAQPSVAIDGYVSLSEVSLDLVEQLERISPFGSGNPPLTLACRGLTVVDDAVLGAGGEHRRIVVQDEAGDHRRVLWWGGANSELPAGRFDLAVVLRASNYRGQRDVQVEWVAARPLEHPTAVLRPPQRSVQVIDCRNIEDQDSELEKLLNDSAVQVWSETTGEQPINGLRRHELQQCSHLAIWTAPPGPVELRKALECTGAGTVYLFGVDPNIDSAKQFLSLLAGLVKSVLSKRDGTVSVTELAAATAQREITARAGIDWLVARGYLIVVEEHGGDLHLASGGQRSIQRMESAETRLRELLEETSTYRRHFRRAGAEAVIARE